MKPAFSFAFAALLALAPWAYADTILYDNTVPADDTGDTVLYSIGPYLALGDEIQLTSAGTADQAEIEMYNNGGAGTFDVDLDLYAVGSPLGTFLGSSSLTDVSTIGGDVLDLTFSLADLIVPQNLIFTVSLSNQNPTDPSDPLDLGLDMFEPPDIGTSDPTFMIAKDTTMTYFQLTTNDEDVYFQLSGTPTQTIPEPSTVALLALGMVLIGTRTAAFQKRPSSRS